MVVSGALNPSEYAEVVERALAEDLADRGDITSDALVEAPVTARARLVAREPGVVAGLDVAAHVFARIDAAVTVERRVEDGERVEAGQVLAEVAGPARSLLAGERTALNLLGRMSGVATATARFVEAVAGTGAKISDTRNTMPGLRVLDKYAVRAGGGVNNRFGLYDAVTIEDNHLATVGDIARAVATAKSKVGPGTMIAVEVEEISQLDEVLETRADRVLLDNMDLATLRRAAELTGGRITIEASGGITLADVREVAETGVDIISVGSITHSAAQLDISLDFEPSDFGTQEPSVASES
ncbi:MAG: carboxylating nicotinate-nucleotide diphosphorylase [Actinobacteria bacterium]|nr:carboxylating nicotinate-nucleotide diphosphorylase [Actinomycetota bacterium]